MSEYIKREDAISQLEPLWDRMHEEGGLIDPDCELGINESIEVIKAIPSADVAEVRHGHWEKIAKVRPECKWDSDYNYECSECHYTDVHNEEVDVPYCWHCGARMDGGEDNA